MPVGMAWAGKTGDDLGTEGDRLAVGRGRDAAHLSRGRADRDARTGDVDLLRGRQAGARVVARGCVHGKDVAVQSDGQGGGRREGVLAAVQRAGADGIGEAAVVDRDGAVGVGRPPMVGATVTVSVNGWL